MCVPKFYIKQNIKLPVNNSSKQDPWGVLAGLAKLTPQQNSFHTGLSWKMCGCVCPAWMTRCLIAFPHIKGTWTLRNSTSTQSIWLFQRHSDVALTSLGGWQLDPPQPAGCVGFGTPSADVSVCNHSLRMVFGAGWQKKLPGFSQEVNREVMCNNSWGVDSPQQLWPSFFLSVWGFLISYKGHIEDFKMLCFVCRFYVWPNSIRLHLQM